MAALPAVSYITLPHHHRVQRGTSHHVDKSVHMGDIILHHHRHRYTHKGTICNQQYALRGNSLKCRSLHESGADADDRFDERAPQAEAWKALKEKIEAFHGEFPKGEAFKSFKELVDQLDSSADSANPQMQLLMGQAKRFLKCPRGSLAHYFNLIRNAENTEHPLLGGWYLETGHACREAGDFEGALHFSSKALETCMKRFGPSSLRVAQARSALAKIYVNLAKYDDALRESQAARPILKSLGNPEHVVSLDLTAADALVNLKKYDEAILILKEVINSSTGLIHINATINVAKAHAALGRNEHVKEYCEKALNALDRQEASNQTAASLLPLASIHEKQGEFEQAALLLTKRIQRYDEEYSENKPQGMISELESKVGRLYMRIGKANEAVPYLESSLSKKKTINGSLSHEQTRNGQELLYTHYYLGAAYSQCKRFHEALEQFEACVLMLSDICRGENPSFAMTVYNNAASMYHFLGRVERQAILFAGDREEFARAVALNEEDRRLAVTWWEIHGRLTSELQSLALRVLSQDCTSGAAERIWSICADIHTKKRNRLSTSQLDKLVYVNANLRLLEKLKSDGEVLQWKVKEVDSQVLAKLEAGLHRGEQIDLSFIQRRTDEDIAYDFLREDEARFRRVTRAQTRSTLAATLSHAFDDEDPSHILEHVGTSSGPTHAGGTRRSIVTYRRGDHRQGGASRGDASRPESRFMREMRARDASDASDASGDSDVDEDIEA